MKKLWLILLVSVAVAGLVWVRFAPRVRAHNFDRDDVRGRYVSAETAYDVSTEHDAGGGNVGSPVFFAATAVMVADGHGNVCGESDGFYGGTPPPGVNLGPNLFHGTYTVEPVTGRITILTASDGAPSLTNVFCGTTTPIDTTGSTLFKTQVGYLQNDHGRTITTSEQINNSDSSQGGCCATTGFLVHARAWTRKSGEED